MNPYYINTEEDSSILALHGLVSSSYGRSVYKVMLQPYGGDKALVEFGTTLPRAKRKLLLLLKSHLWWHCNKLDELNNA